MSLKRSERAVAGAVVFGALFLAIISPLWWHDDDRGWPVVKKTGNYWKDVAEPQERSLLPRHSDILSRAGLTLDVRLADGSEKAYTDDQSAHDLLCGVDGGDVDQCVKYHAWEVSPDRRYVTLKVGFYEGGAALLIDRLTGTELGLDAAPHLSPDGRNWALVDGDDAYGSGTLAVLSNEATGPIISASAVRNYCDFEKWDTPSTFLITCYDFDAEQNAELSVTWDGAGTLTMAPTGRAAPGNP